MWLQTMRIHTNRSFCVRQASDESDLTKMSNVLDLVDQTAFLGERATGASSLGQCVWVSDRAIDIDGRRQSHHPLQRGRLSRRIERSPLPFGRHRWVSSSDPSDL